jgi:leucyl-tRNA synthetase
VGYVLERRALFLFLFFLKKENGDFRLFAFFFLKRRFLGILKRANIKLINGYLILISMQSEEQINLNKIENKWQDKWKNSKIFEAKRDKSKEKFMMIFAYPGISGFLHVGHMRGYSYTDIITRYKRMQGYNVLFPVGTHASGNQAIAFANKVKKNDKEWIDYLKRNGCPEKTIQNLTEPERIVKYFNDVYVNEYWKKFGFLSDWRRFTSTIFPDYNKFIEWQFKKLNDLNLLVQKPYFATACLECGPVAVDPSETDISKGGNAEKQEFTLLKFRLEDKFLIAATLRPETIFGQTNLWVNPKIKLVEIKVNDQKWIVSKESYEKLLNQKDKIELVGDFKENIIGKKVIAPGIEKEVIILPSDFVKGDVGTGIVTSVPSDAPYDYIALRDLQQNKELIKKYQLNEHEIKEIKPIPIIQTKKYGELAGEKIIKENKIENQNDKKLFSLTQEVYKEGFHKGVLLGNCGEYSRMKVIEAKEKMKESLIKSNKADIMYDLSEEVICRCGNKVIVKKIDDQWFIRYSDEKITSETKKHTTEMLIKPKQYKDNIQGVLDWFQDRACARMGNWLGTKLPFDKKWTVEPISDSTLYPIYYLVSLYYNEGKIKLDEMNERFFDYVFLGKGKPENKIWEEIRKDVEYWYPLDINLGGKEHQTVHFPVFLMNHIAILPKNMWPKGIFVNYWIIGNGSKISKSKGGAQPIPEAIEKYGVDSMRLYYSHIASPENDVVWDEKTVINYRKNIERIYRLILKTTELEDKKNEELDKKLLVELNREIKLITDSIEIFDLRTATNSAFFILYSKMNDYLNKSGANKEIINEFVSKWLRLIAPFCPHIAEELWEKLGNKDFISLERWPEANLEIIKKKKIDINQKTTFHIKEIIDKLESKGRKIQKVYVYVMPFELTKLNIKNIKETINKEIQFFSTDDSKKHDPENKARKAKPNLPAIYVEFAKQN